MKPQIYVDWFGGVVLNFGEHDHPYGSLIYTKEVWLDKAVENIWQYLLMIKYGDVKKFTLQAKQKLRDLLSKKWDKSFSF